MTTLPFPIFGSATLTNALIYAGQTPNSVLGALNISQTASGFTSGTGGGAAGSTVFNAINITADTLNVNAPANVQCSFLGSITGTVLTITPPVTGIIKVTTTGSISGTALTLTSAAIGTVTAGLTASWSGGSDVVLFGNFPNYTLAHNQGTVTNRPVTMAGPQPNNIVTWDDGTPTGGSATLVTFAFSGGNQTWTLTTDQGAVGIIPMQVVSAAGVQQGIGLNMTYRFGGGSFGGSRSIARFQGTIGGAITSHNNYQGVFGSMTAQQPGGGTDLWSGSAGNLWGCTFSFGLNKPAGSPGAQFYRGGNACEYDYGCASGLSGTDASISSIAGMALIRFSNHQMVPAIWECDRAFYLGQQPSSVSDGMGGRLPERAAKFGLQVSSFGAFALDNAQGRAIGSCFTFRAYNNDGTLGSLPNQSRHGVDWYNVDWTGSQFRGQGPFTVTGSASSLGAGAVGVGGGYFSATTTTVSLDTAGSICTGISSIATAGAVLYPGLPLINDDTGTIAVVSTVDNAVRLGLGGAVTVALVPGTGRAIQGDIPANPVPFRTSALPLTFPAPGPTGPTLNLTWTRPTIMQLGKSGPDILIGSGSAKALTDTLGFFFFPFCNGTPTGVPTNATSGAAGLYDETAHKLWIYDSGWKSVTFS